MRLEKENSDTVKVHLAKIIEKQKKQPGHLKINYTLKHYGKFL